MNILTWNVANHNHLGTYSPDCMPVEKNIQNVLYRYEHSVNILLFYIRTYRVNIIFLSEVTREYYQLLSSMSSNDPGLLKIFFDEKKGLSTLFFYHTGMFLNIKGIDEVQQPNPKTMDRFTLFNVTALVQLISNVVEIKFMVVNVHGWGDPLTREKYLVTDLKYLNTLPLDKIICGDFNSTLSQIVKASNMNNKIEPAPPGFPSHVTQKYFVFIDYRPTSYHKYVKEGEKFVAKTSDIYTKTDHLLYTNSFSVQSLDVFPENFLEYEYPFNCFKENNGWPSDHTMLIYNIYFKNF